MNLQVELLVPNRVELLWYRLSSFLHLSDLDCHVGITRSGLVLANQALSAFDYRRRKCDIFNNATMSV